MNFTKEKQEILVNQGTKFLLDNCCKGKGCLCMYVDKKRSLHTQVPYCSSIEMMLGDYDIEVIEGVETRVTKGYQIACSEVLGIEGTECNFYEEIYKEYDKD